MKSSESKRSKRQVGPYVLVVVVALIAFGAILYAAIKTSIVDASEWNEKAETMLKLNSLQLAEPKRGNIYTHDGTPLAQTVALYTAYVDFGAPNVDPVLYTDIIHPKGSGKPDTIKLDTLCTYLAEKYPIRTKEGYKKYITARRLEGSRNCVLADNITDTQFEELMNLPTYRDADKSKNSGLSRLRTYKRFYPYDSLTSVVLGRATEATEEMLERNKSYRRKEWHGTSGMERSLDSLLFGVYGTAQRQQRHWGFDERVVDPPVNGCDVVTTLDMTMQEIAERNLMHMVRSQRAQYGTAVIMEVATGEIRAMANVEKNSKGKYTFKTRRNYAITAIEPGSVIKTLSMLMVLEHSNIDVTKEFDSKGAIPEMGNYKTLDFYESPITPQNVIVRSDNRGICKLVGDVYRGRYNDFVADIRRSGLLRTMELPLPGAQPPVINPMYFQKQWQYYAYAQMIFGYYSRISPVSTLSIYNAIANNGRLMQPQIIKSLMQEGRVDTTFAPVCLNEHLCTPEHAAQLREMLHGVVYAPKGTARFIKEGRVEIAGKTGTAKAIRETVTTDAKGNKRYGEEYIEGVWRLAFAGFFPYDNPQYSCIVVIDKPQNKSAGAVAGGVFRAIAEEMYNRNLLECDVEYTPTDTLPLPPRNSVGNELDNTVYNYLKRYPAPLAEEVSEKTNTTVAVEEHNNMPVVPSVIGLGALEALYELESIGMEVELQGAGRVVQQSLQSGIPLQKGMNIKLTLKQ